MPKYATTSWQAREALMDRKPYRTGGAMWATTDPWDVFAGRLPQEWAERYAADRHAEEIAYVVASYYTPIAWVKTDGTIVIPDVKYSRTTSGHQGLLYALRLADVPGNTDGKSQGELDDMSRARDAIRNSAQNERQGERNRRARLRETAVERRIERAGLATRAASVAEEDARLLEAVNRLRAEREEAWEVRQMREGLEREQDEAERRTREITGRATQEDWDRTMAERPTWEDGWNAPRPYATTDGAIYSDAYLFRRNRP